MSKTSRICPFCQQAVVVGKAPEDAGMPTGLPLSELPLYRFDPRSRKATPLDDPKILVDHREVCKMYVESREKARIPHLEKRIQQLATRPRADSQSSKGPRTDGDGPTTPPGPSKSPPGGAGNEEPSEPGSPSFDLDEYEKLLRE